MEGVPENKEKQMRRTIALLTTMAMTLLVATSVALAAVISCPTAQNGTCRGTASADTMKGTAGRDIIDSFRGGDTLNALGANDTLRGGQGTDTLNGGLGDDKLDGGEDSDTYLFEDGWGEDTITGGEVHGYDTLDFSKLSQNVRVVGYPNQTAPSHYIASSVGDRLTWGFPTVQIENIRGGAGDDFLNGTNGGNSLSGAEGHDYLNGRDGNDLLIGGDGPDVFYGGAGDDIINALDHRPPVSGSGPDAVISCGAGRDTVLYDRMFETPAPDCETRLGSPRPLPTN
jgi:Ca2+-binding RTX toxin-like protein